MVRGCPKCGYVGSDVVASTVAATCAVETCDRPVVAGMDPYRPEPETALCASHADVVDAELGGEVLAKA